MKADERLLAAARSDNEELIQEVFEEGGFDINCKDGCVLGHIVDEQLTERLGIA